MLVFLELYEEMGGGVQEEAGVPSVPLVKIPNKSGVFRFGTRNITLLQGENGGVLVRQGVNHMPFEVFVGEI